LPQGADLPYAVACYKHCILNKQLWLTYDQETLREMWLFLYVRIFMTWCWQNCVILFRWRCENIAFYTFGYVLCLVAVKWNIITFLLC